MKSYSGWSDGGGASSPLSPPLLSSGAVALSSSGGGARVGLSRLLAGIGRRIGIAGLRTGIIIAGSSDAGFPQKQRSKCDAGNGIKSHDHAILLVSQA